MVPVLFLSFFLILLSDVQLVFSQSMGFDPREATIDLVHHSLYSGLATCRDVVSSFLARIEALNNHTNAIIALNPNALAPADIMDSALAVGNATGPLFCIPIILKDSYDTADMKTTGGCLALADSQPSIDAPVVKALKQAGAVILGKANMHELALEGISVSSLGGQTINPYDATRTPGGSSGGTGAAVAASFAVFGTGTDTMNSVRSPASANSLFSCRPTRGLISRAGVIPISYTQDALGPIARTVTDVAIALTIMANVSYDPLDNTTALVPASSIGVDYAASVATGSLVGVRLGLLTNFFNRTASDETTPVNNVMDVIVARLRAAGAMIVPINQSIYDVTAIFANYDTQRYEYREEMNAYLERSSLHGVHPETLNQLYATDSITGGGGFLVLPSQYEYVTTALKSSTSNVTYTTVQSGIRNLTLALQATFLVDDLSAIIYPQQKNLVAKLGSPSQYGRNGILAALTGFPVVTVPAGFSPATAEAPVGVPIGLEILGRPWSEEDLLKIAYQIERLTHVRRSPVWARQVVEVGNLTSVPVITPNRGNIPSQYPVGVL